MSHGQEPALNTGALTPACGPGVEPLKAPVSKLEGRTGEGLWVGNQSGGCSEIRDEEVLRDIVVVDPIGSSKNCVSVNIPRKADAWPKIVEVPGIGTIHAIRTRHREVAIASQVRKQVVPFTDGAKVLPPQSVVEGEAGGESKIVLREKAKAVVVRCALSVAGIRLGGEVRSQVQVGQSCHRRIIAILKPSGTDRVAIGPETANRTRADRAPDCH